MSALHGEARGRFQWLETVEDDAGLTIRTARAQLPSGLVVERVNACGGDDADEGAVFISDVAGCEVTLTTAQSVELGAALGELPAG